MKIRLRSSVRDFEERRKRHGWDEAKREGGSLKKRNRYEWSWKKEGRRRGEKKRGRKETKIKAFGGTRGRADGHRRGGRVDGSRSLESAEVWLDAP